MLVLSRKKGESIIVADNIEITILEVNSDTVKIGINAPKEIEVLRKELYLSVKESNKDAAAQAFDPKALERVRQSLQNKKDEL